MSSMEDAMKKAGFKPERQQRRDLGGDNRNRPQREALPEFPSSYFEVDPQSRKYLQPIFVAKQSVDRLARILGKESRPKLTTGQMRRFFNHCREIERQLKVDGRSWHQVSARFEGLCYQAQYAKSAGKIPKEFQDFIDDNVKRVGSAKEPERAFLDGFLPHFEALVGFGAAYMREVS